MAWRRQAGWPGSWKGERRERNRRPREYNSQVSLATLCWACQCHQILLSRVHRWAGVPSEEPAAPNEAAAHPLAWVSMRPLFWVHATAQPWEHGVAGLSPKAQRYLPDAGPLTQHGAHLDWRSWCYCAWWCLSWQHLAALAQQLQGWATGGLCVMAAGLQEQATERVAEEEGSMPEGREQGKIRGHRSECPHGYGPLLSALFVWDESESSSCCRNAVCSRDS